jgi:hypothetical protein
LHPPLCLPSPSPSRSQPLLGVNEEYRSQSREINITLTTKEGDRITISQGATAAHHSIVTQVKGGMQGLAEGMMAVGMSAKIEGDLSSQEINDLIGVFQDLSGIATDFFNGNLAQAVKGAANIGDMGSITSLDATFSRTSVLAKHMQGPHPLPSLFDIQNAQLLPKTNHPDPQVPTSGTVFSTDLPALWQQFIAELSKQEAPPPPPAAPMPQSPAQAGERMLDRGRETMADHPRLSPLLPSVATLAIAQASRQFPLGQPLNQLSNGLTDSFRTAFNNWVL